MGCMNKFKETKQLVLFCLGLRTSLFGHNNNNSYVSYKFLYNCLPIRRAAIRNAVFELGRSGEINKIVSNKQSLASLSSLGKQKLLLLLPTLNFAKQVKPNFLLAVQLAGDSRINNPQNNKTAESFSKAEGETLKKIFRQTINELKKLGFIKLKGGVYLGLNILVKKAEAVVLGRGMAQKILLIPFEKAVFFKAEELSYKLLGFNQKALPCLEVISRAERALKERKHIKDLSFKDNSQVKTIISDGFFALKKLPFAPKSLVLPDWPLETLKSKLKELSDKISEQIAQGSV